MHIPTIVSLIATKLREKIERKRYVASVVLQLMMQPDRYNVFFVALATSLSHNGILIRDLVQILVGDVGIVWILIEFDCAPGGWIYERDGVRTGARSHLCSIVFYCQ